MIISTLFSPAKVSKGHTQTSVRSCWGWLFVCSAGGTLGAGEEKLLLSRRGCMVVHWEREFLQGYSNICRILFRLLRNAALYLLRDTNKVTVNLPHTRMLLESKQQPHISTMIHSYMCSLYRCCLNWPLSFSSAGFYLHLPFSILLHIQFLPHCIYKTLLNVAGINMSCHI